MCLFHNVGLRGDTPKECVYMKKNEPSSRTKEWSKEWSKEFSDNMNECLSKTPCRDMAPDLFDCMKSCAQPVSKLS